LPQQLLRTNFSLANLAAQPNLSNFSLVQGEPSWAELSWENRPGQAAGRRSWEYRPVKQLRSLGVPGKGRRD